MQIVQFSDELWERYRPSIIKHCKKLKVTQPLQDLYVQLATQQKAFIEGDNGEDFAIIHIVPFHQGNSLWIDEAYATSGNAFAKYIEEFKTIARSIPNCTHIRWQSSRLGYLKNAKFLKAIGDYKIEYIVYQLEV